MDKEDWCQYLLQSQCVEKVVSEACPKYCKNCVDSETDQTTSGEIKLNIFERFKVTWRYLIGRLSQTYSQFVFNMYQYPMAKAKQMRQKHQPKKLLLVSLMLVGWFLNNIKYLIFRKNNGIY